MPNTETGTMIDITQYSPIRIGLTAIWRLAFGAVLGSSAVVLIYTMLTEPSTQNSDDPPIWLMWGGAAFIGFIGYAFLSSGVGRLISAFAKGCYFRAGADGIAIRMPKRKWFGRFKILTWRFRWSEVEKLVHFTYRTNGIPTGTQLRIMLNDGTRLTVERECFSMSVRSLQWSLLEFMKKYS
jgi:hypothetical protein